VAASTPRGARLTTHQSCSSFCGVRYSVQEMRLALDIALAMYSRPTSPCLLYNIRELLGSCCCVNHGVNTQPGRTCQADQSRSKSITARIVQVQP
jgi:hypothetical protein